MDQVRHICRDVEVVTRTVLNSALETGDSSSSTVFFRSTERVFVVVSSTLKFVVICVVLH